MLSSGNSHMYMNLNPPISTFDNQNMYNPASAPAPSKVTISRWFPPTMEWKSVVIGIIVIACASFVMLYYCGALIMKMFDKASSHGHQTETQLTSEPTADDPSLQLRHHGLDSQLHGHGLDSQLHGHGLDSSILNSLPAVQFRKKNDGAASQRETECAVCLGEFKEEEWLRYLPNCTHAFHIYCIDAWFRSHSDCPLCRTHVVYNLTDHLGQPITMFTLLRDS